MHILSIAYFLCSCKIDDIETRYIHREERIYKMDFKHNENQIALYSKEGTLLAEITFPNLDDNTVDVNYTFVDSSLRGQGIAGKLMQELVKDLQARGLKAVPTCSYAQGWFEKHSEYAHLIKYNK